MITPNFASAQPFFTLTNSNILYNDNTISLKLFFSFPRIAEIEKMLTNGTSINIDCLAELSQERSLLPNTEIQSLISGWQLRYDSLTREFLLYHENLEPQRSRKLKDLLYNIFSPLELALKHLPQMEAKSNYTIDIQLGLRHATVPPWLEKTLFFWTWDIVNDKYKFKFTLPSK